jgi:Domain of unknown function (DUF4330)
MAIVDERGRLGGQVNLIDAVVAFLILVLIPVAFGAYLLFRTPPARLTALNPATLRQGPNLRIEVQGENLRPFMRVSFNDQQGKTYAIQSTRGAMVELPELGAGTYDVVLYDHMQEVHRLPKALTILPLAPVPTVEMVVDGSFKGLSSDRVKGLKAGDKLVSSGSAAFVMSVGAPVPSAVMLRSGSEMLRVPLEGKTDLPAVLKLQCFVMTTVDGVLKCVVPGPVQQTDVAPGAALSLAAPDGAWATFQIDTVRK